jgi:hypothetical protein
VAGPEITEIVATQNIKGQLLLVIGTNLTGATKVLFGAIEASIATNTAKVASVYIPNTLSLGAYTVKIVTSKGTSNGVQFNLVDTQPTATGSVTLSNGATVSSLPAAYTPPISNVWDNVSDTNERFAMFESGSNTLGFSYGDLEGTGVFDKANNYVEFTLEGIRYVGVWKAPANYNSDLGKYCDHYMTLISTESGKQLTLHVKDLECP